MNFNLAAGAKYYGPSGPMYGGWVSGQGTACHPYAGSTLLIGGIWNQQGFGVDELGNSYYGSGTGC